MKRFLLGFAAAVFLSLFSFPVCAQEVSLSLMTPDEEDVDNIDAQVGDHILVYLKHAHTGEYGFTYKSLMVNGAGNRMFLQPGHRGSTPYGFNSAEHGNMVFVPEGRDAGTTLTITGEAWITPFFKPPEPGPGEEPPRPAEPYSVPVGPVYIRVSALASSDVDAKIDVLRAELLTYVDFINSVPVMEGNKTSNLGTFMRNGGRHLQGHFDH